MTTSKRIFDLLFSMMGLVLLFPVMVMIAILIRLCDRAPVFFVQERVGRYGKSFIMWKFRTMKDDRQPTAGRFDPGDTSRVTPLGRFLRKYKLDELPQLINVVRGEMSLVGPRPEVRRWVTVYPERWNRVLTVVPGITDNASLFYRKEEELLHQSADPDQFYREMVLPGKLSLYEEYVDHHSLKGDILLIARTIFCCLFK